VLACVSVSRTFKDCFGETAETSTRDARATRQKRITEREIWIDLLRQIGNNSVFQSQDRSECNHGCVVGAQPGFSDKEFDTIFVAGGAQIFPQRAITTHAAAQRQTARFGLLQRAQTLLAQDIDDCLLKGGAEIRQHVIPSVSRGIPMRYL
jgi:hypothetical protein